MSKHHWVALQMTPVEVEKKDDGTLSVTATESAIEIAVDESMIGCWFCGEPATTENHDDECPHEAPQAN